MKKYSLNWKEIDDDGIDVEDLVEVILNDKELSEVTAISIGFWGEPWTDSSQPLIDMFVNHKEKFNHVEELFIGDMDFEDCEVSWIQQGDYTTLYQAMPQLKRLSIKGSDGLEMGQIEHPNLTHLEIICGGLPSNVLEELSHAKLPNLESLILYIGVEGYGFNGTIDNIHPLLKKDLFPKLRILGLVDSRIQDEIAKIIMESDIVYQLEELLLGYGTLGDEGALTILNHADKLSNLKRLDLEHHYISKEMMDKLKKLPFEVNLDDAGDPNPKDSWDKYPILTE